MTFVHETRQDDTAADLAVRIGAALPFIAGVHTAPPPYDAPDGAALGNGVSVDARTHQIAVCCFVVLDTRLGVSVVHHSGLIESVVTALVSRVVQRPCTVTVVVTDVLTQGTHV